MISIEEITNNLKGIYKNTDYQRFYSFDTVDSICDLAYFIWHFGKNIYLSINTNEGTIKLSMQHIKDKEDTYLLTSVKLPRMRKIKFDTK